MHNREEGKSQRGVLIWLTLDRSSNEKPVVAYLIYWESKKGERVARSSLAAETQSVQEGIATGTFLNNLFEEIVGHKIPMDVRTDAESLCTTLFTVKRPRDLRLYADICGLREDLKNEVIRSLRHVPDPKNLSDVLTKRHVAKKKRELLRHALMTGTIFQLQ